MRRLIDRHTLLPVCNARVACLLATCPCLLPDTFRLCVGGRIGMSAFIGGSTQRRPAPWPNITALCTHWVLPLIALIFSKLSALDLPALAQASAHAVSDSLLPPFGGTAGHR